MFAQENKMHSLAEIGLKQSLSFAAAYLKSALCHPFSLCETDGMIQFSCPNAAAKQYDLMVPHYAALLKCEGYYYHKDLHVLYFYMDCVHFATVVMMKKIASSEVVYFISLLRETRQALVCFFTNLRQMKKTHDSAKQEFLRYLLSCCTQENRAAAQSLLGLCAPELCRAAHYIVCALQPSQGVAADTLQEAYRHFLRLTKTSALQGVVLRHSTCLFLIVPVYDALNGAKAPAQVFARSVEKLLHMTNGAVRSSLSAGIGQVQPIDQLRRSCYEAQIALILTGLSEQRPFIRRFDDLNIYSLLFSQSIDALRNCCQSILEPLLTQANDKTAELFITLRALLISNFNWKMTAEKLFIHVNTLHYRAEKIEQLLALDLLQAENRFRLSAAIKIWDALRLLEENQKFD